jgi:superfamily II DNA/RNA helicase
MEEKKQTRSFANRGARPAYGGTRRAVVLGGIGGGGRYEPPRKRTKKSNFIGNIERGGAPEASATQTTETPRAFTPRTQNAWSARPNSSRDSGARGKTFGGGSRGGYSRGGGASGRPQKRGNMKNPGENIDVNRFVSRAVVVAEEKVYSPTHQFSDLKIEQKLKDNIAKKGYTIPTAIQDQSIPEVLKGRDLIGIANTGEGKTAAFLIPLINKMILRPESRVLVIVPTRELALQIDEEFMGFSRGLGIYSVLLVGGTSMGMQIERLRRKVRMVIGTPGRLKDLVDRGELKLGEFDNLVLDEADRMLDMGFITDIKYIIERMQKERHTLFFSATFSREIEDLAQRMLREPIRISVKKQDTSKNIEQDIVRFREKGEKFTLLCDFLHKAEFNKVLVFGRTKHGVEKLGRDLQQAGFRAASIHGNKTQPQRQRALKDFKDDRVQILVATDVAARGLDIPNVSHVINYEVPGTYDDYVHRIGRTGRAGKKGNALTFVEG